MRFVDQLREMIDRVEQADELFDDEATNAYLLDLIQLSVARLRRRGVAISAERTGFEPSALRPADKQEAS